jgi:Tfp pilus assembly protein PilN
LLPAEPVVTVSRAVLVASLALLLATGGMVGPWALAHVNARRAALVQTERERALSAEVAHLRTNAAEIAALREDAAGRTAPFAGELLRRLAATIPPEVTLATLRADAGSFAAQGFLAPQAAGGVLDRWQHALAQDRERSQVQIETLPKRDGAFYLRGQSKT